MSHETTTPIEETVRLSCLFRLAKPEDIKATPKQLRYGQLCVTRSAQTGAFDGGFFTLTTDTDVMMIKELLEMKQLYVPVNYFDNTIREEQQ